MRTRRPLRVAGFDYAQPGAYFVTLCASGRGSLFGDVVDANVELNAVGRIVAEQVAAASTRFANVAVDIYQVLPDHLHAIFVLDETAPRSFLSVVVGSIKSCASRSARAVAGRPLWQRGFYDHVIRDEVDMNRVREYIATNPVRWAERHRAVGVGRASPAPAVAGGASLSS